MALLYYNGPLVSKHFLVLFSYFGGENADFQSRGGVGVDDGQRKFITEYLVDLNATQAARRAGYSERTANEQGSRLLANASIKAEIDRQLQEMQRRTIADATEVMQYLTSVMRGEQVEETVVVEATGDFCSKARKLDKAVGAKERIRAAELLGRRYGLTEKIDLGGEIGVVIRDDIDGAAE